MRTESAEPNSACYCSESERSETKISVYYPRVITDKDSNARATAMQRSYSKSLSDTIEYWLIKKEKASRRHIIWLLPQPLPPLPSERPTGDRQEDLERETIADTGEEVGGGGGAKSYDGEKAWSSVNYSILSGCSQLHL
jgi:hypothetical protein